MPRLHEAITHLSHGGSVFVNLLGPNDASELSRLCDAVDFGHGRHHVVDMLDDMREMDALEAVGRERPGILVEIPDDVGGRAWGPVDAERARLHLAGAAADVEDDTLVDALVRDGVGGHVRFR